MAATKPCKLLACTQPIAVYILPSLSAGSLVKPPLGVQKRYWGMGVVSGTLLPPPDVQQLKRYVLSPEREGSRHFTGFVLHLVLQFVAICQLLTYTQPDSIPVQKGREQLKPDGGVMYVQVFVPWSQVKFELLAQEDMPFDWLGQHCSPYCPHGTQHTCNTGQLPSSSIVP